MIYQKASTGFRLGASIGIIILMLGIAVFVSISADSVISDQTKSVTNFEVPLEEAVGQVINTHENQKNYVSNALRFLQENDTKAFQLARAEFSMSESNMAVELGHSRDLINFRISELPTDYAGTNPSLTLTKFDEMEKTYTEYEQSARDFFSVYDTSDRSKVVTLENDLINKENLLATKQADLMAGIKSSYSAIEGSIDQNRQRFLMIEITIIAAVGIISVISGHFVSQINHDLMREVSRKTKSLQKANAKLQRLNILKDDFINEASHELKSPLNPIYGFVELAKCGDIDKESALSGIAKQARQIEEVANKMLDLGKIDSQKLCLNVEKFELNDLITEITEAARITSKEKVSIITQLSGRIEIEADRVRIGQVIRNLLNNALKFTYDGSIHVTSSNDGLNAKVAVTDSGTGIHPDVLPRLFDKFVTINHRNENPEGSGLGLYICKGIIDAHKGRISARNNPANGATISFSVPLVQKNNDHALHTLTN